MQQTTPHAPVTSKDNVQIRQLRALVETKNRRKERAFLAEGVKMAEEALRDRRDVKLIVAAPTLLQHHGKGVLKLAESRGVSILWISERLMDRLSDTRTPQPVMAVVPIIHFDEEALLNAGAGLIVMAHQLQDPGNLGALIRTAEAAGAAGLVISANTVDPYNAKAVRASMGSILRLPVIQTLDPRAFMAMSRERGYQVVATAPNGDTPLFDADLTKATVVLFGQEGSGLPREFAPEIDLSVSIPIAGTVDSLNVAASAAVVLYEAMRQRRFA